jgi:hypothetical protein
MTTNKCSAPACARLASRRVRYTRPGQLFPSDVRVMCDEHAGFARGLAVGMATANRPNTMQVEVSDLARSGATL